MILLLMLQAIIQFIIHIHTPSSSWSDMNNVTAGPLGEHTACWGTCRMITLLAFEV